MGVAPSNPEAQAVQTTFTGESSASHLEAETVVPPPFSGDSKPNRTWHSRVKTYVIAVLSDLAGDPEELDDTEVSLKMQRANDAFLCYIYYLFSGDETCHRLHRDLPNQVRSARTHQGELGQENSLALHLKIVCCIYHFRD